ncbi:MAG: ABC transporter ATP-binding protein/permease [Sutterellaceae bacterium]|nr:ABC transporter ATP-binding protein/permease [Sutterellaceae bacterium]
MNQLKVFWQLIRPFWTQSEGRKAAMFLLLVVIALSLSSVWFSVRLNEWNGAFFNAIQKLDGPTIYSLLGDFILIVSAFVVVLVYTDWLQKKLIIDWRTWMTKNVCARWLSSDSRHYRLQLESLQPDNPDQRIAEDINILIEVSLDLLISFLRSVLTLVSFITILWTLSGTLDFTLIGIDFSVPGYMVWACLAYTLVATAITHWIGKPLMKLNFAQQKREANFRTGLIARIHNAEAIAGQHGEESECRRLLDIFHRVQTNWRQLMDKNRNLSFFTVGFGQVTQLAPIFFALPKFLSGAIQLGGLMQIRIAFGQVASAVGWFIYSYRDIAKWSATVDRLTSFEKVLNCPVAVREQEVRNEPPALQADVSLQLPDGKPLLGPVSLKAEIGKLTVIKGASGIGKSCLLRALAGFWPHYEGTISRLPAAAVWIPQRIWLAPLSLKALLAYPADAQSLSDESCRAALAEVGLDRLAQGSLDEEDQPWQQRLSGGEQQRLMIARILLRKPKLLLLDEITSALDARSTQEVLDLLREKLAQSAIVFVSHQSEVHQRADTLIEIKG